MGTSLSGLTPATTFDGLLKTSDNEPLDGTLKAISTGDGTDTILSLSNSALQIDGDVTINNSTASAEMTITDNGVTLGSVGNGGTLRLLRSSGGLIYGTISTDNSQLRIQGNNNVNNILVSPNTSNGITITDDTTPLGAKLGVKGFGATSATTSLLVQNSAGEQHLKVEDGGKVFLGNNNIAVDGATISRATTSISLGTNLNYNCIDRHTFNTYNGATFTEVMRITGNGPDQNVGIGETTPTARLQVKGSGNDATTTSLLVQNSDGTDGLYVKDALEWGIGYGNSNKIDGNNNNLYIRHNQLFFMSGGNYFAKMTSAGFQVGNGAGTATARLQVKGSGATSATTALLVQNSAGTELFKVNDDGAVRSNGIKGIIYPNNHLSLGANAEFLGFNSISATKIGVNIPVPSGVQAVIKGSGATSATTALLVQNSAGTDLLKVEDGGDVTIGSAGGRVTMVAGYNNRFEANRLSFYQTTTNIRGINAGGQGLIISKNTGTADLYPSAILAVDSTTQGFLPPRMTQGERDAIATPAAGLMIYNTDTNTAECWNGSAWMPMF